MYKHLDKLNVKSNLPTDQITQYTTKKFRTSSDICKYSCTLEEEILKEEESSSIEIITADRRKSSARNEDIMKSLAELRDEFKQPETGNTTSVKVEPVQKPPVNNSTVLRMKAETVAEVFLGTDDTVLFLKFLDFYVNLMESLEISDVPDEKVVKSFNIFDGNVEKSREFLVTAVELEELGFEEDKVVSALMLFSNDREAALDFLMKN